VPFISANKRDGCDFPQGLLSPRKRIPLESQHTVVERRKKLIKTLIKNYSNLRILDVLESGIARLEFLLYLLQVIDLHPVNILCRFVCENIRVPWKYFVLPNKVSSYLSLKIFSLKITYYLWKDFM
jgi:hypothetical protein